MKYLINETTKEERALLVYKALGISMSDPEEPSSKTLALANEYIEGNMELEDVQKKVIEMHKKGFEENE